MCLIDVSSTMNNTDKDELLHVIYDYTSKNDDELTLKRGSILEVLSKDEKISGSEGWWTGRLIDSESVGIFPADFVASSEPNLKIIDYKDLSIGALIGVGGFGHVHCGKFGDIDVAIKTAKSLVSYNANGPSASLKTPGDDQSNAVRKNLIDGLLHEARLFSNLNHRNIIQLFGVSPSSINKNLYLVMEYAHGGALADILQRRKAGLYPNVFIQYAKQIADGMDYLHGEAPEHIIHRDLKCSNILILENVQNIHDDNELLQKTLKITDFGLAKKQLQSSSGTTAGTFAWMSPECIRSNEFSPKSDVWSFGVLLWECLTGEIPYQGFDQMQVAFGVATNKYSLPIPSTCPEEFSQLMKDCWHVAPQDRLTFAQLCDQIDTIIETSYVDNQLSNMQPDEESYSSLQQDWRKEIKEIFEELKSKEQEIRNREQAMLQLNIEQNHQRMQLERWEHELREREMHVIERELTLLMLPNHQERLQQRTPKVHKRSGRFMRQLLHVTLNGGVSLSSATSLISSPTNFRHLISVCRDSTGPRHHHSTFDSGSSSTLPIPSPSDGSASKSTPTTPNLSRFRTLTASGDLTISMIDDGEYLINNDVHLPLLPNGLSPTTPPEKPPRCLSADQSQTSSATMPRPRWRKPKTWSSPSSSTIKRKHAKSSIRPGEAKWYLESISSVNTTNDNTTNSTPPTNESNPKTENSDDPGSSSSSTCSTPNDRSLARAFLDINSVLVSIGLGRRVPEPQPPSTPSSTSTTKSSVHQTILRSSSETNPKQNFSPSSSTNTTPSPSTKKQHKRTCSSPITNTVTRTNGITNVGYRARTCFSPDRPTSLVFPSTPPSPSKPDISHSDSQLDEKHRNQKKRYATLIHTPEEDIEQTTDDEHDQFYSAQSSKLSTPMIPSLHLSSSQPQLHFPCILDIDTEEQTTHTTQVLPPAVNRKKSHLSRHASERDFLP